MAATVVIYSLATSKLKELQHLDATTVDNMFTPNDWVKTDNLTKTLTAVYSVPKHLVATKHNIDANIFYFNAIAHCATIRVNRNAQKLARIRSSSLATEFLQESISQCLTAASAIFDLSKLASQSQIRVVRRMRFVYSILQTNRPIASSRIILLRLFRPSHICRIVHSEERYKV